MAPDAFSLARHNRYDVLKQLLAQHEVEVDQRDDKGNTILLVACQNGLRRVAKLALRHGADINATNDAGNSALHFCFMYGFSDSIGALLLQGGADDTLMNKRGQTCFQCRFELQSGGGAAGYEEGPSYQGQWSGDLDQWLGVDDEPGQNPNASLAAATELEWSPEPGPSGAADPEWEGAASPSEAPPSRHGLGVRTVRSFRLKKSDPHRPPADSSPLAAASPKLLRTASAVRLRVAPTRRPPPLDSPRSRPSPATEATSDDSAVSPGDEQTPTAPATPPASAGTRQVTKAAEEVRDPGPTRTTDHAAAALTSPTSPVGDEQSAQMQLMEAMASHEFEAMRSALERASTREVHAAMLHACARSNVGAIKVLLPQAPGVCVMQGTIICARRGDLAALELLVDACPAQGVSNALVQAAGGGHAALVSLLLLRRQPDPLCLRRAVVASASRGQTAALAALIPATAENAEATKAALVASCANEQAATATLLLDCVPVAAMDQALAICAAQGHAQLVRCMLERMTRQAKPGDAEHLWFACEHARNVARAKGHADVEALLDGHLEAAVGGRAARCAFDRAVA